MIINIFIYNSLLSTDSHLINVFSQDAVFLNCLITVAYFATVSSSEWMT